MRLVIFGLAISSAWGNGHAALWRGLIGALHAAGHQVTFFERNVPWYADHRDLTALPGGGTLVLYDDWDPTQARRTMRDSDAAIVTSYCPDALAAAALLADTPGPLRCFYDLDTPVTLARRDAGETVSYLPPEGLGGFDLVLSYTGGAALTALRDDLGARRVVPLYGWVDPAVHAPAPPPPASLSPAAPPPAALSYLGTYAADRQPALERLFLAPARRRPEQRFLLGGAQYPPDFPWTRNLFFRRHVPPADHPAFYAAARLTLNVTRAAMAALGWCPSGRLFEAAACGVPILSDAWPGLEAFFTPGSEILLAADTDDVLAALDWPDAALAGLARRARERALDEHTAAHRAATLVAALAAAQAGVPA